MISQVSFCAKGRLRFRAAQRACSVTALAVLLSAACANEDEETQVTRELAEAQTAMAFCDQQPANCDAEELAKRNSTLSVAEANANALQKKRTAIVK